MEPTFANVKPIAEGASAQVYRASLNGEWLALKVAKQPHFVSTLAREAWHASLSQSRHLPSLRKLGILQLDGDVARLTSTGGQAFIATRWQPGKTLAAAPFDALQLAHDLSLALGALHELGLAHGDVKPSNIVHDGRRAGLIDLGLAGPAHRITMDGATVRYLAAGGQPLGSAQARDLLALGLVLAEQIDPRIAASSMPLSAAKSLLTEHAAHPVAKICTVLLAPADLRPPAHWVTAKAKAALRTSAHWQPESAQLDWSDDIRRAYLRVRYEELAQAEHVAHEAAPYAQNAMAVLRQARAMCQQFGEAAPTGIQVRTVEPVEPLQAEGRLRLLAALTGSVAAHWNDLARLDLSEEIFCSRLCELASKKKPRHWSLPDVQTTLMQVGPARESQQHDFGHEGDGLARLCLAIGRSTASAAALDWVQEHATELPLTVRLLAADTMRLRGELGRAHSLLLDQDEDAAVLIRLNVARLGGHRDEAKHLAQSLLAQNDRAPTKARALLARILLDEGQIEEAAKLLQHVQDTATGCETAALVANAKGESAKALQHGLRSQALADNDEERARAAATVAFLQHGQSPERCWYHYQQAVRFAINAGAVLEEASYRTGEAATAVQLGRLEDAVRSATRATILFEEVLQSPQKAARAWLARAAAHAALGNRHETIHAAERAIERSQKDTNARHYARLAIADAHELEDEVAIVQCEALAEQSLACSDQPTLRLHIAARLWRHLPKRITRLQKQDLDNLAKDGTATNVNARLAWWKARAERLLHQQENNEAPAEAEAILEQLNQLVRGEGTVVAVGQAMFAAERLAHSMGDTKRLERVTARRHQAAKQIIAHCTSLLAERVATCPWLQSRNTSADLVQALAIDLRQLVIALSERHDLEVLLERILDVLLLWTGAERGLFLMANEDDQLEVRAGRNINRARLSDEQHELSRSLAMQAARSAEPVVTVDATQELASEHASVHALQLRSVMAVPMLAQGQVVAVVYLDDRVRRNVFGSEQIQLAQEIAPIAALAIEDAKTQLELRSAINRATYASRELEELLAKRESELAVAARELAHHVADHEAKEFRADGIIGKSAPIQKMLRLVSRIAASDVPVLLHGESGSGKELVARALHRHSNRALKPFVSENCGALPDSLLESTLFGHVRGAFTGAHRQRIGLFEAAHGGTLFLDEIGEMSANMQIKLLRILEDSMVRPVGATQSRQVNVRIVCASHRNLDQMVKAGTFREDLLYRLNVITVPIPSLREHAEDIPLLVEHMLKKHAPERQIRISSEAIEQLCSFDWPGNVRQLENEIRRALLLCDASIQIQHLSIQPSPQKQKPNLGLRLHDHVDELERNLVLEALEQTQGNQTQAAKLLGISRYGLHKMIKRLELQWRQLSKNQP